MDIEARTTLADLLNRQRIAALGTLREGAPFVSMVPFVAARDISGFYIHISHLAQHTRDILADPRVSLMVAHPDSGAGDPQTLARVSIQGEALATRREQDGYEFARSLYLARFPDAAFNFTLADFALFRVVPNDARFVAGFGRIFNLKPSHLAEACAAQ